MQVQHICGFMFSWMLYGYVHVVDRTSDASCAGRNGSGGLQIHTLWPCTGYFCPRGSTAPHECSTWDYCRAGSDAPL